MGTPAHPDATRQPSASLAGFVHDLRAAGVPVSTGRFHAYLSALETVDVNRRDHVYATGLCTLCSAPIHLEVYDEVFRRWFDGASEELLLDQYSAQDQVVLAMQPSDSGEGEQQEELDILSEASAIEVLRRKDFTELTPEERREIQELLRNLPWHPQERRTRRRTTAPSGLIDRRRTVRAAMRTAGEVQRLRRSRLRTRPRRVLFLVDVSGSMRDYAMPFLRFAHVAIRRYGAPTEVFTLGTRLTRVTPQLGARDPDAALRRTSRAIEDWHGGTRLGDGLKVFLDGWGQRGVARGAIVVILSDGWERGDPSLLGAQVARLSRLAYRVIWANPRAAKPGYEPRVGGMAASLPHVDHLVDASSVAAMSELVDLINTAASRSRPRELA